MSVRYICNHKVYPSIKYAAYDNRHCVDAPIMAWLPDYDSLETALQQYATVRSQHTVGLVLDLMA